MAAAAGSSLPAAPSLPSPCLPSTAAAVPADASAPFLGLGLKAPLATLPCASPPFSSSGSDQQLQRQQSGGMGERHAATGGLLCGSCSGGGGAGERTYGRMLLLPLTALLCLLCFARHASVLLDWVTASSCFPFLDNCL